METAGTALERADGKAARGQPFLHAVIIDMHLGTEGAQCALGEYRKAMAIALEGALVAISGNGRGGLWHRCGHDEMKLMNNAAKIGNQPIIVKA